ncbi:MAG: c-type cytochrome [Alphaproteobacteria bacterium]|jgi:cytochrome c553|nr:c-type cytochrome [Alphaproteobacteria bacterium]MDP6590204.1 c-type cytochrome [Alphaproteobacteria bacterium]MDP6818682.1 c-type cytochrome [Alphaproteobacteria bacterium]|tara:strand:- start:1899 stop:2198 length:300 start_codon:yes stop_codon:yes gene_type:complete
MKAKGGLLLTAIVLLAFPVGALADEPSPTVLANTCFSCHGTDGKSPGAMPSLDEKSASYIAQTLREFRSDEIENTVMSRIAKGFSDAEIDALAEQLGRK